MYVDGLILRADTTLLWQFDGGYVDLNANGTPTSWNYYVTDHLGSTRMVVSSNDSIRETINYYPFGSEMRMEAPAQMTGDLQQPYRFTGKELDRQNGLNWYDFGARWYDVAGVPMWTSVDPLAEKAPWVTPYMYCVGDPVNKFDPDGRSTRVKALEDGTYQVIGGDINDKDRNIYVYGQDDNGDYTVRGESIGITSSTTSFYDSDANQGCGAWVIGATIDPNDNSGKMFLNKVASEEVTLDEYMDKARNNHPYDFKVTNGGDNLISKNDDYIYRGMCIGTTVFGQTIYSSARDIGNMAAGMVAAKNGCSWSAARLAFDMYQSRHGLQREGLSTRNAQYYGWSQKYSRSNGISEAENLKKSINSFFRRLRNKIF